MQTPTFYNHVQILKHILLNSAYDIVVLCSRTFCKTKLSLPNRPGRQPTYLIQVLKKISLSYWCGFFFLNENTMITMWLTIPTLLTILTILTIDIYYAYNTNRLLTMFTILTIITILTILAKLKVQLAYTKLKQLGPRFSKLIYTICFCHNGAANSDPVI